jgi:hypothetical protein
MRVTPFGLNSIALVVLAAYSLLAGVQQPSRAVNQSSTLRRFLRDYLRDPYIARDTTTRYFAAPVDLSDNRGGQVIVYFTDRSSCGSGGCTTLVLAPQGLSYKVVTSITIGWAPIRVLKTKNHGWHDLGIWVRGGGIQRGYEADLPFNGTTYPSNPSVPPARPLTVTVPGVVIVPEDAAGVALY